MRIDKVELSSRKVSDWQAVGLHWQSNSRYLVSEFRSHAFGVVSDHALVSFLFQWTRKKKLKMKSRLSKTSLTSRAWKSSESVDLRRGLREPDVYDSVRGFAFFEHEHNILCVHQTDAVTTAKTHGSWEGRFFHQKLEARDTQTTV